MVVMLAIVVIGGFAGAARNVTDNRTQAGQVADIIKAEAKPGDAVVYCPDQIAPAVNRLVGSPKGLDQFTFPREAAPGLVNWIDYQDHIDATVPDHFTADALARVPKSGTIWYVYNPGYHGVEGKCEQVLGGLQAARPGSRVRVTSDDATFFESDNLIQLPPA